MTNQDRAVTAAEHCMTCTCSPITVLEENIIYFVSAWFDAQRRLVDLKNNITVEELSRKTGIAVEALAGLHDWDAKDYS